MPEDSTATATATAPAAAAPAAPAQAASPAPGAGSDPASAPYQQLFNADGTFREGWTNNLGDEFAPFRETLAAKKFKGLDGLLSSYANIERKMGAAGNDEFVRVPGENPPAEVVEQFRQKLGIPSKPEGYEIKRPDALPEEAWNDERAGKFAALAHELNLPKAAAAKLVEFQGQLYAQGVEEANAATKAATEAADAALRQDWGADYDRNMDLAARAVSHAGYDPADPLFSRPEYVKLAHAFGRMVDEAKLPAIKGETVDFQSDPAKQFQAIQENKDHPYWSRPGQPGYNRATHERAVELMSRLSIEIERRKARGG